MSWFVRPSLTARHSTRYEAFGTLYRVAGPYFGSEGLSQVLGIPVKVYRVGDSTATVSASRVGKV